MADATSDPQPEPELLPSSAASQPVSNTTTIFGDVTDETRVPIDPDQLGLGVAFVIATDDSGERKHTRIHAGTYAIEDLNPGSWTLSCRVAGFWPRADTKLLVPDGVASIRQDFVLDQGWLMNVKFETDGGEDLIAVIIREDLRSLLPICVVATRDDPGPRLPATTADHYEEYEIGYWFDRGNMPEGYFKDVPTEYFGRLEVKSRPPAYASATLRNFVLQTQRLDAVTDTLVFHIPFEKVRALLASLTFKVIDHATGQPVSAGDVTLGSFATNRKLDESGIVSYDRLAPGKRQLLILRTGFARFSETVTLEPGQTLDLGTIVLSAPTTVRGTVTDREGHPLALNFSLNRLVADDPYASLLSERQHAVQSNKDGQFVVDGLAAGRYVVRFGEFHARDGPGQQEPSWSMAPLLVDVPPSGLDLELTVERTQPLIVKPSAKDIVGKRFLVMTRDGLPYRRGFVEEMPGAMLLAPGEYGLRLVGSSTVTTFRIASTAVELEIVP